MPDMQTDIEVLKTEVRGLQAGISELGAKMDVVLAMQVQMVRLQEQQDGQRQAIERAFSSLSETKRQLGEVDTRVHRALSFVRGAAFVAVIAVGMVQWYVIDQINTLKQTGFDLKAVDRRVTVVESKLWPDVSGGGR